MKYRGKQDITKHLIEHSIVSEEELERNAILTFVKSLPIEELKRLVQFERLDPDSEQSMEKLRDINTPQYEIDEIRSLMNRGVVRYKFKHIGMKQVDNGGRLIEFGVPDADGDIFDFNSVKIAGEINHVEVDDRGVRLIKDFTIKEASIIPKNNRK